MRGNFMISCCMTDNGVEISDLAAMSTIEVLRVGIDSDSDVAVLSLGAMAVNGAVLIGKTRAQKQFSELKLIVRVKVGVDVQYYAVILDQPRSAESSTVVRLDGPS